MRILSPAQIERCLIEQSSGIDAVANVPMRFGLAYRLTQLAALYGPNPRPSAIPARAARWGSPIPMQRSDLPTS